MMTCPHCRNTGYVHTVDLEPYGNTVVERRETYFCTCEAGSLAERDEQFEREMLETEAE